MEIVYPNYSQIVEYFIMAHFDRVTWPMRSSSALNNISKLTEINEFKPHTNQCYQSNLCVRSNQIVRAPACPNTQFSVRCRLCRWGMFQLSFLYTNYSCLSSIVLISTSMTTLNVYTRVIKSSVCLITQFFTHNVHTWYGLFSN